MSAAIALGGFTGPEADTLGYAIRKKKSSRPARAEGAVRHARPPSGASAGGHRRGLHGLRAVRALRLQQGPRHLLRPDRLPDRLPQGELHGRVHDQRADRLPRQRPRRSPPRSPSAAGSASRSGRRTSTARASSSRSRATRSASACWPSRTSARARSSRSSPPARPRAAIPLAGRLLRADRPAPGQQAGARVAGQGRRARPRSATRPRSSPASTTRSPRPGHPARPDQRPDRRCSTWPRPTRPLERAAARRSPRRRSASGCAGRRSCSGCTSPTTRSGEIAEAIGPLRHGLLGRPAATSRSTSSGSSSAGS